MNNIRRKYNPTVDLSKFTFNKKNIITNYSKFTCGLRGGISCTRHICQVQDIQNRGSVRLYLAYQWFET